MSETSNASATLEAEVERAAGALRTLLSQELAAEADEAHQSVGLDRYVATVQSMGAAADSAEMLGLRDVCLLVQERVQQIRSHQRSITGAERKLLERWPALVVDYTATPNIGGEALLAFLRDDTWNAPLSDRESKMLGELIAVPKSAPAIFRSSHTHQVLDAKTLRQATLVAIGTLSSNLGPSDDLVRDPDSAANALHSYANFATQVRAIAEEAGLKGLKNVSLLFNERVSLLTREARALHHEERALVERWPALVTDYIDDPGQKWAGDALVEHLKNSRWRKPILGKHAESLAILLTGVVDPAATETRRPAPTQASTASYEDPSPAIETEDNDATIIDVDLNHGAATRGDVSRQAANITTGAAPTSLLNSATTVGETGEDIPAAAADDAVDLDFSFFDLDHAADSVADESDDTGTVLDLDAVRFDSEAIDNSSSGSNDAADSILVDIGHAPDITTIADSAADGVDLDLSDAIPEIDDVASFDDTGTVLDLDAVRFDSEAIDNSSSGSNDAADSILVDIGHAPDITTIADSAADGVDLDSSDAIPVIDDVASFDDTGTVLDLDAVRFDHEGGDDSVINPNEKTDSVLVDIGPASDITTIAGENNVDFDLSDAIPVSDDVPNFDDTGTVLDLDAVRFDHYGGDDSIIDSNDDADTVLVDIGHAPDITAVVDNVADSVDFDLSDAIPVSDDVANFDDTGTVLDLDAVRFDHDGVDNSSIDSNKNDDTVLVDVGPAPDITTIAGENNVDFDLSDAIPVSDDVPNLDDTGTVLDLDAVRVDHDGVDNSSIDSNKNDDTVLVDVGPAPDITAIAGEDNVDFDLSDAIPAIDDVPNFDDTGTVLDLDAVRFDHEGGDDSIIDSNDDDADTVLVDIGHAPDITAVVDNVADSVDFDLSDAIPVSDDVPNLDDTGTVLDLDAVRFDHDGVDNSSIDSNKNDDTVLVDVGPAPDITTIAGENNVDLDLSDAIPAIDDVPNFDDTGTVLDLDAVRFDDEEIDDSNSEDADTVLVDIGPVPDITAIADNAADSVDLDLSELTEPMRAGDDTLEFDDTGTVLDLDALTFGHAGIDDSSGDSNNDEDTVLTDPGPATDIGTAMGDAVDLDLSQWDQPGSATNDAVDFDDTGTVPIDPVSAPNIIETQDPAIGTQINITGTSANDPAAPALAAQIDSELVAVLRLEIQRITEEFRNGAPTVGTAEAAPDGERRYSALQAELDQMARAIAEHLPGLHRLLLHVTESRPQIDDEVPDSTLCESLLSHVSAYLEAPTEAHSAAALVRCCQDERWRHPLSRTDGLAFTELLSNVRLHVSEHTRPTLAQADDVSLALPVDVHPALMRGLLQELPVQTREFTEAIQRLVTDTGSQQDVETAKRAAHNLKGAGDTVGVRGIVSLTHHVEDILNALSQHNALPNVSLGTTLMRTADTLEYMSESLAGQSPSPLDARAVLQEVLDWANRIDAEGLSDDRSEAQSRPGPDDSSGDTTAQALSDAPMLRVPAPLLDNLLRLTGEAIIHTGQLQDNHHRMLRDSDSLEHQTEMLQELVMELEDSVNLHIADGSQKPLEADASETLRTCTQRLVEAAADTREHGRELATRLNILKELLVDQGRLNRSIQEAALRTRMVPVSNLVPRLQRSVRQGCRLTGKECELTVAGTETLVDNDVLGDLADPLMHLLRNAVDHGIETPQAREALGKPRAGLLALNFTREGNAVVVRCTDDGAGLDLDAIRVRALEQGLVDAQSTPSDDELQRVVLTPGFSTRREATRMSGRGVGLDAVNERIQRMKGTMTITSEAGRQCTIEMRLPVTLMSAHALLVRAQQRVFAVLDRDIRQILHSTGGELDRTGDAMRYSVGNVSYEAHLLEELLGLPKDRRVLDRSTRPALLVAYDGNERIVLVEELIDGRDLVIKSTGHYIPRLNGVAGATILGDGSVAPVLDLPELIRSPAKLHPEEPQDGTHEPTEREPARRTALVVEDSPTTRRSLIQTLSDAGHDVRGARDGVEALELIDKLRPDVMLIDLEMPRMNGIDLLASIRAREDTKDLPVIVVTAHVSRRKREQAMAAGANAYFSKPYSASELIQQVNSLQSF